MAATQLQLRRDTNTNLAAATPASGEPGWNTTSKRLHMGDGARLGGWQLPNFSDIQTQSFGYGSAGGTGNALTLTLSPALLSYTAGVSVEVKATASNSGNATIDINGLGTKNIYKMAEGVLGGLEAGDIVSGGVYRMTYDGTQFQIKALDENPAAAAGLTLLATVSGSGSSFDFTSLIDSTYRTYMFTLENVLPSAFGDMYLRVRRSGQGSFDSTSNHYNYEAGQGGQILLATGVDKASPNGGIGVSGSIIATGLGQATYAFFTYQTAHGAFTTDDRAKGMTGSGLRLTTTALDGVRILPSVGTIVSGRVNMYGVTTTL